MFNEEKVAQMAGYLLLKRGGRMALLKLMKLLYLCDRESMKLYAEPMSNDIWVSMKNGPVLSQTYDLFSNGSRKCDGVWNKWISGKEDHDVSLKFTPTENDFSELSPADTEILDSIYEKFGHINRWKLVDYTHDNLPEWEDPKGSAVRISPYSVFIGLGHTPDKAKLLVERLDEINELDDLACRMK